MTDYTESERIERAEHARRLEQDKLLNEALNEVGLDAMRRLAEVDAADTNEILRLQAIVHCAGAMMDHITAAIYASGANDGGVAIQDDPLGR